ncbi:MAG: hypothetical protein AAF491_10315 [Verrucomicrobiota bacterium]
MKKRRDLLAPWIWITVVLLFAIGVPWYWDPENDSVTFGFPTWTVVSVSVSFLISAFTAWIFLTRWPRDEEEDS